MDEPRADETKVPAEGSSSDETNESRRQFTRKLGGMLFAVTVVDVVDLSFLGKPAFAQGTRCFGTEGDNTCGHTQPGSDPPVSNPDSSITPNCGAGGDPDACNSGNPDGNCGNATPNGPKPTDPDEACTQYKGGTTRYDPDQNCNKSTGGAGNLVDQDNSCQAGTVPKHTFDADGSCGKAYPNSNNFTDQDNSCSPGTAGNNPTTAEYDSNCFKTLANGNVDSDNSCGSNLDDTDESCKSLNGYGYDNDQACVVSSAGQDALCNAPRPVNKGGGYDIDGYLGYCAYKNSTDSYTPY